MKAVVTRWMCINEITPKRGVSLAATFLVLLFCIVFQSCVETTTLRINKTGDGHGTIYVYWGSSEITCRSDTTITFLKNAEITLEAVPNPASSFSTWESPNIPLVECNSPIGDSTCINVKMTENKTIEAVFNEVGFKLTIQKQGGGDVRAGSVQDPVGNLIDPPINCINKTGLAPCREASHYFPSGTRVVIQAFPRWIGPIVWGGDCTCEPVPTCIVLMDRDRTVTVVVP